MKKKYLFGALLGLLLSTPIFAQSNIGVDYLNTGELKVAKEIFEKQISQSPAEAYYYLGEVAYKEGNMAEAKANYEKGLAASPNFTLNEVGLAKLMLKSDPKAGESMLSDAIKKDKKNVQVLVAVADAYYSNKMVDKGAKVLEDAKKVDKKSPMIYLLEGDLIAGTNVGDAAGFYAQAYTFDPNCAVAYIKTAKVYETVNPTLAIEMLEKAVEINPNYTLAYKLLGSIYSKNGQYAKAIEAYKKYFAQGSYDVEDLTRYAAALYFTEQYAQAKQLINEGIGKAPNHFVLNRLLMYSDLQSEDYTEGLAQAEKFFALPKGEKDEYIVLDYMNYGELLSKNNQLDKALVQYAEAVKLDPSKSGVYKDIAQACAEGKQYAQAAEYFGQYIDKSSPDVIQATDYFNMGKNYYSAGGQVLSDKENPDAQTQAKEYYNKASDAFAIVAQRVPESTLGYLWRARANASLDPETTEGLAKPFYEELINVINKKDDGSGTTELVEAYRYMGYYYYLLFTKSNSASDKDEVKSYCEKILVLDPENTVATQLIEAIK